MQFKAIPATRGVLVVGGKNLANAAEGRPAVGGIGDKTLVNAALKHSCGMGALGGNI